jgi:segregation and condensation protein A
VSARLGFSAGGDPVKFRTAVLSRGPRWVSPRSFPRSSRPKILTFLASLAELYFPLAAHLRRPSIGFIVVPDSDYRIKLQVFEGPLDLLLFLIRKNELDIYDIPIESVTRQYIDALHAMQQLDLDLAGEFFVMAATLMEIKSRLLLPKGQHAVDPNADDEEMDPRWELVHQLLQYKKFKEAAATLAGMVETRQNLMLRHVSTLSSDAVDRPLKAVDRIELWNTFNMVLRRLAEKLVVGEIHDEMVTVTDQMEWLLERIQTERSFIFSQLFPDGVTLRRLVATFLAMLELTRLKKLRIRQTEAFTDIVGEAVVEDPIVENPLETARNPPTVTA